VKKDDNVAQLIISKGKQVINTFKIKADDKLLTIGLLHSNDIFLPDDKRFVSRSHAAIIRLDSPKKEEHPCNIPMKESSYLIRDLGSTQGTKIGKNFIHKKVLEDGDEIQISDYTLVFKQAHSPEDRITGLPLDELYDQLPPENSYKQETVLRPVKKVSTDQLTQEQKEFILSITKTSLGADFTETPHNLMNSLLKLTRAEKALVGFYKNEKIHIIYQNGFERESPYCKEEFLSRLWREGPVRQEGALWIPLPEKGFLALFRNMPPPFKKDDLNFMHHVCECLMELHIPVHELHELTPWPLSVVGLSDIKKKCISIAGAENVENSDALILGETGTGKEVLARYIHENSIRKGGPFVSVNCASLPKDLAYSELFGHERGAFTGANIRKSGYFEIAHGGTLFLDEIGDVPESIQVALLTAMQQREIRRLGSEKTTSVDVRILAATDRDLEQGMQDDTFRRALYERFGYKISIPPLRERKEDIPLLAYYFLDMYSKDTQAISREGLQCMRDYDWPGNVRELQNIIKSVVLTKNEMIFSWDLPATIRHARKVQQYQEKIQKSLKETEKERIIMVLDETRGNVDQAARILGISRATLYNKLKEYDIQRDCRKSK